MQLSKQLAQYIDACFAGIWIQSHEHEDAIMEIAQLCRDQQWWLGNETGRATLTLGVGSLMGSA